MAVYVSELRTCLKNKNWKWPQSSHLVADTVAELHSFASILGLKMEWYQYKTVPHYDLTENKFRAAQKLGAKLLTDKEFVAFIGEHRIVDTKPNITRTRT